MGRLSLKDYIDNNLGLYTISWKDYHSKILIYPKKPRTCRATKFNRWGQELNQCRHYKRNYKLKTYEITIQTHILT
jgi:hypothetical protein